MDEVRLVVRDTLRQHPVVPRSGRWFCWKCLHYFVGGPDPVCPNDILQEVRWPP